MSTDPKQNTTKWNSEVTEAYVTYNLQWRLDNPDRYAAAFGQWQAISHGAVLPATYDFEATVPFYREARTLTRQTGKLYVVDHVIPCHEGGLHCSSNMQVITQTENRIKG